MSSKKEDKKMKPTDKRPLVPKRRFPEFRDAGEWEVKPLRELAKRCTLKNGQGKLTRVLTNSAEFGVVDQRDFFDKDIANQNNLEGYYIVEKGDYVYNPRISASAPVGPVSKNNTATGVMSPLYTIFRFDNRQNDFYAHFFKTTGWHHYMRRSSSTGARHDRIAITNDEFLALPLPVPPLAEQQKIADCLSSFDELISLEAQRLDALKAHKKGMMKRLFPGEGETVPRLRFPEFRDAGEWAGRELGEFIQERIQLANNGEPLFSLTIDDGVTPKTERYERSFLVTDETEAYKLMLPDDFAYNPMNLRFGAIARHAGNANVGVSKYYNIFYCDRSVDAKFCAIYFKSPRMVDFYNRMATGSLIEKRRVHFTEFLKFVIPFPVLKEQQRIADCLSSLDELITAQSERLATLKTHKKGLMQQLFPELDAGRER